MEARKLFFPEIILLNVVIITILATIADRLLRIVASFLTRWSEREGR